MNEQVVAGVALPVSNRRFPSNRFEFVYPISTPGQVADPLSGPTAAVGVAVRTRLVRVIKIETQGPIDEPGLRELPADRLWHNIQVGFEQVALAMLHDLQEADRVLDDERRATATMVSGNFEAGLYLRLEAQTWPRIEGVTVDVVKPSRTPIPPIDPGARYE